MTLLWRMLYILGLGTFFVSFREHFTEDYYSEDLLSVHGIVHAECLHTHRGNMSPCFNINENHAFL